MRKLAVLVAMVVGFSTISLPALAAKDDTTGGTSGGGTEASILTGCASSDDGVGCILRLVVDIMSIGIGILGVIGITIVGIQYLTAGGNEEQTRKAKHRMFEIVIGLVAYVILYAILRWLLPGYNGV